MELLPPRPKTEKAEVVTDHYGLGASPPSSPQDPLKERPALPLPPPLPASAVPSSGAFPEPGTLVSPRSLSGAPTLEGRGVGPPSIETEIAAYESLVRELHTLEEKVRLQALVLWDRLGYDPLSLELHSSGTDQARSGGRREPRRIRVDRSRVAGMSMLVPRSAGDALWSTSRRLGFVGGETLVVTLGDLAADVAGSPEPGCEVFRIGSEEDLRMLSPEELGRLMERVSEHYRAHPGGLVVLTDPGAIVKGPAFEGWLRGVRVVQRLAKERKGSFLTAVDLEGLSPEDRIEARRGMHVVIRESDRSEPRSASGASPSENGRLAD